MPSWCVSLPDVSANGRIGLAPQRAMPPPFRPQRQSSPSIRVASCSAQRRSLAAWVFKRGPCNDFPCPLPGCGGTDRFQYTDRFGEGNYFCRSCGAGGGIKLAQGVLGLKFGELLERVESQVGKVQATKRSGINTVSPLRMRQLAQRIWNEARPVVPGDEVDRYLRNRGVRMERYPRSLRFHPALGYYVKKGTDKRSTKVAEYPAMLACVQGRDGHAVTLHRTYLRNGQKLALADAGDTARKLLSSGINGAAIRLGQPAEALGITEGIETGLAVRLDHNVPVWAAVSCGNMERVWVPDWVREVRIYADNDADSEFAGQVSAYLLARRLAREAKAAGLPREVKVLVPPTAGSDWLDERVAGLAATLQAA
jgi:putative DNA primase/helicase